MNRCTVLVLAGLCAHSLETQSAAASFCHRLIILADMGNEPDEEQQMAHMLVCSNEFDLDGLIAVTGKFLRTTPQPELLLKLIGGYEKVLPNLKLHAQGWPTAGYLRGITVAGQNNYGMADVGEGKSSAGSKLIVAAVTRDEPRPELVADDVHGLQVSRLSSSHPKREKPWLKVSNSTRVRVDGREHGGSER